MAYWRGLPTETTRDPEDANVGLMIASASRVLLARPRAAQRPVPATGPLRIAMAIESLLLGGAEVVMLQLSEELRRRGHTVFPIGPGDRDGWLRRSFATRGFEFHAYDLWRPIDFPCAERMAAQLRALDVQVVHSQEFVMGLCCAAAATVAVSRDADTHLERRLRPRPESVEVARNGFPDRPEGRSRVRRGCGLADDAPHAFGRPPDEAEGRSMLLEAMLLVERTAPTASWFVAIAGQGSERVPHEALVVERGLRAREHLLSNCDAVPDLQAADIFVLPSPWEGLPLAVLEAMFAARPVIATTSSGIPEAVADSVYGLAIYRSDPETFVSAAHRFLTDSALRTYLGGSACQRAKRDFSSTAMADPCECLFRS